MKTVLVLLVIAAGAYFLLNRSEDGGPQTEAAITDPFYAEIRIEVPVQSRQIELVLFGKMADENDCRTRTGIVWGDVIEGCEACRQTVSTCTPTLEPKYLRLFDNEPTNTAYLSFTSGEPAERDARMVIWGVTEAEGNAICKGIRKGFQKGYKGKVECVDGQAE